MPFNTENKNVAALPFFLRCMFNIRGENSILILKIFFFSAVRFLCLVFIFKEVIFFVLVTISLLLIKLETSK